MNFFRTFYIAPVFFRWLAVCVVLFVAGYFVPVYFTIAQTSLAILVGLLLIDIILLYARGWNFKVKRIIPTQCGLGDVHQVIITVANDNPAPFKVIIYDEAPVQLQLRDNVFIIHIPAFSEEKLHYTFQPAERGIFKFGNINLLISSVLRLAQRKIIIESPMETAVYPSVLVMKQYELKVFSKVTLTQGIKRVRRLGHSNDFEQIRNYVQGDDYRKINWKATSRKNELMMNQYEDEKAQQVYCILDKSRSMQATFDGLSLLDHAINSALVFSNIAIRKSDRIGLITFSDKMGATLQAERAASQMKKIMEILYRQQTKFTESNYEGMYANLKKTIKGRSLLILYTNFESNYALERRLAILRKLNKHHVLVVVFFEDTELHALNETESKSVKEIYLQTIARKLAIEKQHMVMELRKYGIQSVLTTPQKLTTDTINKYLEIKSRGLI